jgi:hypothetical protein
MIFVFTARRRPQTRIIGSVGPYTCERCGNGDRMSLAVSEVQQTLNGFKVGTPTVTGYCLACRSCSSVSFLTPTDAVALARCPMPATAADRLPPGLLGPLDTPAGKLAHNAATATFGAMVAWIATALLVVIALTSKGQAHSAGMLVADLMIVAAIAISVAAAAFRWKLGAIRVS